MKIHLGCGARYIEGWQNIDWSDKYKVDHQMDIGAEKLPFEDGAATRVISSHLIEHLNRWEGEHHLKEIYRVLGKGGELILAFPDLIRIIDCFEGRDRSVNVQGSDDWLVEAIFETQKDETVVHKYGYTCNTLRRLLKSVGFETIEDIRNEVFVDGQRICDYRYAISILRAVK